MNEVIPIVAVHALAIALDVEHTWKESVAETGTGNWPHGYCAESAIGLRDELDEKLPEAGAEFIWGMFITTYGPGPVFAPEHAWLELGGGFILDVTAGQFFRRWAPLPLIPPWTPLAERYSLLERNPDWARG